MCRAFQSDSSGQEMVIGAEAAPNLPGRARLWAILLVGTGWLAAGVLGQGIPEPDLVMYGVVRNISDGLNARVTVGDLSWTFQPVGGGAPIVVSAALENVNDQFSYILRIPCETLAGVVPSSGVLGLGGSFNRRQVRVTGVEAALTDAAQETLSLASTDRGRIDRVDLVVSLGQTGLLPEDWQMKYFGRTGIDPFDDADHDGVNNFDEYRAGTNPIDPASLFEVKVSDDASGGPQLEWISAPGKSYTIERSRDLTSGFEVLAAGVPATPPTNVFRDGAGGGGTSFYRVRVESEGP